ncbi:hypothetical protein ACWGI8_40810, partial [Streptomyces sp. NPDC054841]
IQLSGRGVVAVLRRYGLVPAHGPAPRPLQFAVDVPDNPAAAQILRAILSDAAHLLNTEGYLPTQGRSEIMQGPAGLTLYAVSEGQITSWTWLPPMPSELDPGIQLHPYADLTTDLGALVPKEDTTVTQLAGNPSQGMLFASVDDDRIPVVRQLGAGLAQQHRMVRVLLQLSGGRPALLVEPGDGRPALLFPVPPARLLRKLAAHNMAKRAIQLLFDATPAQLAAAVATGTVDWWVAELRRLNKHAVATPGSGAVWRFDNALKDVVLRATTQTTDQGPPLEWDGRLSRHPGKLSFELGTAGQLTLRDSPVGIDVGFGFVVDIARVRHLRGPQQQVKLYTLEFTHQAADGTLHLKYEAQGPSQTVSPEQVVTLLARLGVPGDAELALAPQRRVGLGDLPPTPELRRSQQQALRAFARAVSAVRMRSTHFPVEGAAARLDLVLDTPEVTGLVLSEHPREERLWEQESVTGQNSTAVEYSPGLLRSTDAPYVYRSGTALISTPDSAQLLALRDAKEVTGGQTLLIALPVDEQGNLGLATGTGHRALTWDQLVDEIATVLGLGAPVDAPSIRTFVLAVDAPVDSAADQRLVETSRRLAERFKVRLYLPEVRHLLETEHDQGVSSLRAVNPDRRTMGGWRELGTGQLELPTYRVTSTGKLQKLGQAVRSVSARGGVPVAIATTSGLPKLARVDGLLKVFITLQNGLPALRFTDGADAAVAQVRPEQFVTWLNLDELRLPDDTAIQIILDLSVPAERQADLSAWLEAVGRLVPHTVHHSMRAAYSDAELRDMVLPTPGDVWKALLFADRPQQQVGHVTDPMGRLILADETLRLLLEGTILSWQGQARSQSLTLAYPGPAPLNDDGHPVHQVDLARFIAWAKARGAFEPVRLLIDTVPAPLRTQALADAQSLSQALGVGFEQVHGLQQPGGALHDRRVNWHVLTGTLAQDAGQALVAVDGSMLPDAGTPLPAVTSAANVLLFTEARPRNLVHLSAALVRAGLFFLDVDVFYDQSAAWKVGRQQRTSADLAATLHRHGFDRERHTLVVAPGWPKNRKQQELLDGLVTSLAKALRARTLHPGFGHRVDITPLGAVQLSPRGRGGLRGAGAARWVYRDATVPGAPTPGNLSVGPQSTLARADLPVLFGGAKGVTASPYRGDHEQLYKYLLRAEKNADMPVALHLDPALSEQGNVVGSLALPLPGGGVLDSAQGIQGRLTDIGVSPKAAIQIIAPSPAFAQAWQQRVAQATALAIVRDQAPVHLPEQGAYATVDSTGSGSTPKARFSKHRTAAWHTVDLRQRPGLPEVTDLHGELIKGGMPITHQGAGQAERFAATAAVPSVLLQQMNDRPIPGGLYRIGTD